jgi:hypothetical protein
MDLYIGPYVQCEREIVDVTVDRIGCSNCKKTVIILIGHSFCNYCGTRYGTFTETVQESSIDVVDLTENTLKGRFYHIYDFSPKYDTYLPGCRLKVIKRDLYVDLLPGELFKVPTNVVQDETEAFLVQFKKELKILENTYKKMYEVGWGIFKDKGSWR